MTICLINSAPGWGGGERMFMELALGLQRAGHAVTMVCRPGSVLAKKLPGAVELRPMPCRSDFDGVTLVRLFRLLRQRRYHAVFCNQGRDCVLAGIAALPLRIPVVRIKAMEETRRNPRNWLIYHALLSAVVAVSGPVAAGLAPVGIPTERVHIIHNGIEITPPAVDRAAARTQFGLQATDFAVAYTGRLVGEKGVDLLPEIASQVVAAGVPLRLLVAGDGPLRSEIEAACAARRLGEHVFFLGFLDEPLVVLIAADAAIMPSRTEAFPVAALEALAMRTPLVVTRAGGLVEIVADEDTALMTPVEDPVALAGALIRLYRERPLADRLRERGYARARHFSRERMVARYESLVRSLRPNLLRMHVEGGRPA